MQVASQKRKYKWFYHLYCGPQNHIRSFLDMGWCDTTRLNGSRVRVVNVAFPGCMFTGRLSHSKQHKNRSTSEVKVVENADDFSKEIHVKKDASKLVDVSPAGCHGRMRTPVSTPSRHVRPHPKRAVHVKEQKICCICLIGIINVKPSKWLRCDLLLHNPRIRKG